MKMVRAEGAIGWINSGDLLCARNGSGVKGTGIFIWRKCGQGGRIFVDHEVGDHGRF